MAITSNVFQRTFQIKAPGGYGTCFSVDVQGKRYLLTARHVAQDVKDNVAVRHEGVWKDVSVDVIGHGEGDIDISVLAPNYPFGASHPLPATSRGLVFGQDVFILGYPFGISTDVGKVNSDLPLPIVKRATMAGSTKSDEHNNLLHALLLDVFGNEGFSGGPVVYDPHSGSGKASEFCVAGVVAHYRPTKRPIYVEGTDTPSGLYYFENPSILVAYNIKYATDIINDNPKGLELTSPSSQSPF